MEVAVLSSKVFAIVWLSAAGATPPTWVSDYGEGLRFELIEGDLQQSVMAYRRVIVSAAPRVYAQRARYRLARVLDQMGRAQESRAVLQSLRQELPKDGLLAQEVDHLLRHDRDRLREMGYWIEQLNHAALGRDMTRLQEAASVLAFSEGTQGVEAIVSTVNQSSLCESARAMLLESLAQSEALEALSVIRNALTDTRVEVLAAAARATGAIGDAASARRLAELLSSGSATVRAGAAHSLGLLRHLPAIDSLLVRFQTDGSAAVRDAASASLFCIGSARVVNTLRSAGVETVAFLRESPFSTWYRESVTPDAGMQEGLPGEVRSENAPAPRVGIVVSAMSHHARGWGRLFTPYTRQIRKAWTLRRAGFDVCLLAEPEVLKDADATDLTKLLDPSVPLYPLGQWPRCHVIVLDELSDLPGAVIQTVSQYCTSGGHVILCGAVGGRWCDDKVVLRELVGIRRSHLHVFRNDTVELSWQEPASAPSVRLPTVFRTPWVAPRCGSYHTHEPPVGQVLARFDAPEVWAIKTHGLGRGRVIHLNWSVGLNATGVQDEDELLCRCVDLLTDGGISWSRPQYRLLKFVRWGGLSEAKSAVTAVSIGSVPPSERAETLAQLFRLYRMENNLVEGRRVCSAMPAAVGDAPANREMLGTAEQIPDRLLIALRVVGEPPWWCDIPVWLRPIGQVPLWLSGPAALPAEVLLRIPPGRTTRYRLKTQGVSIVTVRDAAAELRGQGTDGTYDILCRSAAQDAPWIELSLLMNTWTARIDLRAAGSGER